MRRGESQNSFLRQWVGNRILCVISVSFLKRRTVDLEHGVVYFDYVRVARVVIIFIHALNPERDLHCVVQHEWSPSAQFPPGSQLVAETLRHLPRTTQTH